MKKILLLCFLSLSLFGYTSVQKIKYESGISIYGQIGFADLTYSEDAENKKYKLEIATRSIGIVKTLTSNREEVYTSEGIIENNVYKPLKFIRTTTKTDYKRVRTYIFDYENNIVHKTETKEFLEDSFNFDTDTFAFEDASEMKYEEHKEDIELHKNDFLTLYLNLKHGNIKKGKVSYIDMKEDDALYLIDDKTFEVHKDYGEERYAIVLIPDSSGIFFKKAMSVGIAFYGDAYIKKLEQSIQLLN